MLKTPPMVAVPLSVPVPFPLSVKMTPGGNVLVCAMDGVGTPVTVTLKEPAAPAGKDTLAGLLIVGAKLVGTTVAASATGDFVSTFPTKSRATL
jgi:hypothetical protein